jgi:hypothetical protein
VSFDAGIRTLDAARWRSIAVITFIAVVLYVGFRALPTGTNLHSADFAVQGKGMVDYCDPANPQFIPVATARSPVEMTLVGDAPAVPGKTGRYVLGLKTSTGKPVGPADLLVSHTRKLHLLIADPTLSDYQHVHPEPGTRPGEWTFAFAPRLAGTYRVFADFTPVATARGLYASADLPVAGSVAPSPHELSWRADVDGYRFQLSSGGAPIVARQIVNLTFTLTRADGGLVPLEPVMDAYAHLVAFDVDRGGFAHLHPNETDLTRRPDGVRPCLTFKVTLPSSGLYVIWAQVKLGGREVFAPFWFEVAP